jgi:hypothetical protein
MSWPRINQARLGPERVALFAVGSCAARPPPWASLAQAPPSSQKSPKGGGASLIGTNRRLTQREGFRN